MVENPETGYYRNLDNIYDNYYLSESRITAKRYLAYAVIACVAVSIFFEGLLILAAFVTSGIAAGLMFIAFMIPLFAAKVFGVIWSIRTLQRCERANVYGSIFLEDHDGIVTYDTIVGMTGYTPERVISDLRWMVSKGVIANVRLGRAEARALVMPDKKKEIYTVICPNCGNSIVMHANSGAKCDHCGTYMIMKEE